MTEERNESNQGDKSAERDLRSILQGRESAAGPGQREIERPPAPRESDEPTGRPRDDRREQNGDSKPVKLPPVWPGDETQPWYRREQGLPPLPRPEDEKVSPEDFPTELADPATRGKGWLISFGIPNAVSILGTVGLFIAVLMGLANIVLYRQGQDLGALVFRMRVLRENGDVAGFFHMWTRYFASLISLLALGAGYWTALSDPKGRTWHDKWLGTYVVKDAPEYRTRTRSSSETAIKWFVVTFVLFFVVPVLLTVFYAPALEPPAP